MTECQPNTSEPSAPQGKTPDVAYPIEVQQIPSHDADSDELRAAEQLVKQSFGSGFRDDDWHHGLGGTHVFVNDDTNTLLAHAAVVPRIIRHGTSALRVGYVEAVAVKPDLQGRGLGRVLMDQVESILHANYQFGALNAIEDAVPFYLHRGWALWTGATAALDRAGKSIATNNVDDRIMLLKRRLHIQEIDQSLTLT